MKLEQKYADKIIERGEEYLDSVEYCLKINNFIYGQVRGSIKYKTEVDKDFNDGSAAGVTGTPSFFINGRLTVGAQPYSVFKSIIEEELNKK